VSTRYYHLNKTLYVIFLSRLLPTEKMAGKILIDILTYYLNLEILGKFYSVIFKNILFIYLRERERD